MDRFEFFKYGEKSAMKKLFTEYHYDKMCEKPEILKNGIPEYEIDEFMTWMKSKGKSRWKYLLFTINFRHGIDLKLVLKQIGKSLKKKWIVDWIWCLETRGMLGEEIYGIHAHIRVKVTNGKYSYECKREMYNTFKNIVGNVQHVNVRYGNREGSFIEYVKGIKKEKIKENALIDKIYRGKNKLEDYYEKPNKSVLDS